MNNSFYPAVVDSFLKTPDKIREYALSLEYKPADNFSFPGTRSENLESLNPQFKKDFITKVLKIYCPEGTAEQASYKKSLVYFQKHHLYSEDKHKAENKGWIHQDHDLFNSIAGVVYLTPDADLECGTSLYRAKDKRVTASDWNRTEFETQKYNLLRYNKLDKDNYRKAHKDWQGRFEETVRINNVYNRLIAYSSTEYHSINKYQVSDKERLTIVFFIQNIKGIPIPKLKLSSDNLDEYV
tara:strand:+ start:1172 stop:1891 length:720 start_codon:yes stop_codon:yes gene_type:complete